MKPWILSQCDHQWVGWSGKNRCRKCGATQGSTTEQTGSSQRGGLVHPER